MNKFCLVLIALLFSNLFFSQNEKEANLILEKVSLKLNNLKTFSYDLRRDVNYFSEDFHNSSNWNCFINYAENKNELGFKFQIGNKDFQSIYNGTEYFSLDILKKEIETEKDSLKDFISSQSYFYNSVITLRNILPKIIEDTTIIKSLDKEKIDNSKYYKIILKTGLKTFQNIGKNFNEIKPNNPKIIFELIIDRSSYLPLSIVQKNDRNNDYVKTTFTNYNFNPIIPNENSWNASNYKKEYKSLEIKEIKFLSVGEIPPNFSLKDFVNNKNVSLNDYKGKVVLLDFWIKNCSPCIEAVPKLNALNEKFKNKNFQLISINPIDNDKNIAFFKKKYNADYMILKDGKNAGADYFVNGYPTMFVINKKGEIIYSSYDVETADKDISKIIEEELIKN